MSGTETETVRRPWDPLKYTLGQIAKHNIPIEQICRAVKKENRAAVKQYLAGGLPSGNWRIDCTILSIVQDIVDARRSEQRQIEEPRELHCAPRHPGIRGRECCVLTWSREQFLDLVRLSQPELVDGLIEEKSEANDEADSGEEEDGEQETMNENTTLTISDAILEADEFTRIELPERKVFLAPWLKERSIALISGPRGVGKTMFGIGLAEAIVRGEQFGPWKAGEPVPCLYLDGEMTVQDIQERLLQLKHTSARKSPLYVYSDAYASHLGMPRAHLASEDWRTKMKQILLAKGVKVWVVDNLASLTAGIDENSKKDWDPINAWLLELRFAGVADVMLHHTGKGGAQRGTSAREDNVDVSIMLKRPSNYKPLDGARFVVKFEKARVRTKYLPSLADVEFRLIEDEQGRGVWVWKSAKGKTKVEVLKRLNEGSDYDAICEETGLKSKGRITQIKNEAKENGWLDKKGKLTPDGLRFVYGEED